MKRRNAYYQLRNALLNARHEKGLTQVEVAAFLNKPQSFVSKYESGERRLDIIEFLEVCKALKVNPLIIIQHLEINDG